MPPSSRLVLELRHSCWILAMNSVLAVKFLSYPSVMVLFELLHYWLILVLGYYCWILATNSVSAVKFRCYLSVMVLIRLLLH